MLRLNSVKSSLRNEIIAQLKDQNLKKERKNVLEMVLNAIGGLYGLGIYIYPNIIELLQINGFKGSSLFCDTLSNIMEKIRNELKDHVEWISNRTFKKGNVKDKNIIFCYLLFTYREHFINYLHDYLLENKQNEKNKIKNLICHLQKIINDAQNNYKKNALPSNKISIQIENDQNSKNPIMENRIIINNQVVFDFKKLSKELDEFSSFDNFFMSF